MAIHEETSKTAPILANSRVEIPLYVEISLDILLQERVPLLI